MFRITNGLVCVITGVLASYANAVTVPKPSNPWEQSSTNDPFSALISEFSTARNTQDQTITNKFVELANKGDLRARLVFIGNYPRAGDEKLALEAFKAIDNSQDAKLLYEIAKIMQLRLSLCLTTSGSGSAQIVERRCSATYDSVKTEELTNQFNGKYIDYFSKSAELGYADAQLELALILMRKPSEIPNNSAGNINKLAGRSSMEWLEAASTKSSKAQEILAAFKNEDKQKSENELRERAVAIKHEKLRPDCTFVRFTGIASAAAPELIDQALSSQDIEDTLARNPISCDRMACYGVAYFSNHKGRITGWSEKYVTLVSPVDFNSGRADISLTILRDDYLCED